MDRRFTFANDQIIKKLQTEFVPAVGNTHELQNQHFDSSKWFMAMATGVNPRVAQGVTAQGFYVAGADGTGYAFNNNRSPDLVLAFLKRGMDGYASHPPKAVNVSDAEINAVYAHGPAPTTTVLQVYSRIRPLPDGCDELNKNIGRDFLWVYPEEVRAIRSASLPDALVRRLLRYHLVDNVRGEPNMWQSSEIRKSAFNIKALSQSRFAITGTFSMSSADGKRGLGGEFEGELTVADKEDKLTGFKAFAKTTAWGAGTYTPSPPPGRFTILFAIVPATAAYAKDTPPAAALYGDWDYRKPPEK